MLRIPYQRCSKKPYLILGLLALLGLVSSPRANAVSCRYGSSAPITPLVGFPTTLTVSSSDTPGTVIARASYTYVGGKGGGGNLQIICPQAAQGWYYYGATSWRTAVSSVVPGMTPFTVSLGPLGGGLGLRLLYNGQQVTNFAFDPSGGASYLQAVPITSIYGAADGYAYLPQATFELQIVKTEMNPSNPITSIPATTVGVYGGFRITAPDNPSGPVLFSGYNNAINVVWPKATCTIIAGDQNKSVTLPTLKSSDFNSSPNPIAGTRAPITITAGNCQGASSATFTFSGQSAGAPNTAVFKNLLEGTGGGASGVGVRLFVGTDPSGQTIGANGTSDPPPVAVTGGDGGQAVLTLGAQYYKTGATVGAGLVSSKAMVTMSYN